MHQSGELLLLSPEGRLRLLDAVFLRYDDLVAQTDVLKVETIASVYLVAANGAPLKPPFVTAQSPFLLSSQPHSKADPESLAYFSFFFHCLLCM